MDDKTRKLAVAADEELERLQWLIEKYERSYRAGKPLVSRETVDAPNARRMNLIEACVGYVFGE